MIASHMRGLLRRTALASLLVLSAATGMSGCSHEPDSTNGQAGATAEAGPGGPFKLIDTKGRSVTNQTLKGKSYAIFFDFTRCPDVCPTTMSRMALLHKKLGADAARMNVVFVLVDPEHDKREDFASFLSMFDAPVNRPHQRCGRAEAHGAGLQYLYRAGAVAQRRLHDRS